jgi:hypothetical protein
MEIAPTFVPALVSEKHKGPESSRPTVAEL